MYFITYRVSHLFGFWRRNDIFSAPRCSDKSELCPTLSDKLVAQSHVSYFEIRCRSGLAGNLITITWKDSLR